MHENNLKSVLLNPLLFLSRAPDPWSKGCEFESRQKRRDNVLPQSELSVLILIRCPLHTRVASVARKRPRSFLQKCRRQVTPEYAYTLDSTKSERADYVVQAFWRNLSGKRTHSQLVRERSAAVVSAPLAIVDWFWLKKWNLCARFISTGGWGWGNAAGIDSTKVFPRNPLERAKIPHRTVITVPDCWTHSFQSFSQIRGLDFLHISCQEMRLTLRIIIHSVNFCTTRSGAVRKYSHCTYHYQNLWTAQVLHLPWLHLPSELHWRVGWNDVPYRDQDQWFFKNQFLAPPLIEQILTSF